MVKDKLSNVVINNFLDSGLILHDTPYLSSTAHGELGVMGMLSMITVFLAGSVPNLSVVFLEACISSATESLGDQQWLEQVAPDEMELLALLPADPGDIEGLTNSTLNAQLQMLGLTVRTLCLQPVGKPLSDYFIHRQPGELRSLPLEDYRSICSVICHSLLLGFPTAEAFEASQAVGAFRKGLAIFISPRIPSLSEASSSLDMFAP